MAQQHAGVVLIKLSSIASACINIRHERRIKTTRGRCWFNDKNFGPVGLAGLKTVIRALYGGNHFHERKRLCSCIVGLVENYVILEVAILDVKSGDEKAFEAAFSKAQKIISSMHGYVSHQLQKCIEKPNRYILLVNWQTLEDHTLGFRKSSEYQEWRALLHHFYEPFPVVEHYHRVYP